METGRGTGRGTGRDMDTVPDMRDNTAGYMSLPRVCSNRYMYHKPGIQAHMPGKP